MTKKQYQENIDKYKKLSKQYKEISDKIDEYNKLAEQLSTEMWYLKNEIMEEK